MQYIKHKDMIVGIGGENVTLKMLYKGYKSGDEQCVVLCNMFGVSLFSQFKKLEEENEKSDKERS